MKVCLIVLLLLPVVAVWGQNYGCAQWGSQCSRFGQRCCGNMICNSNTQRCSNSGGGGGGGDCATSRDQCNSLRPCCQGTCNTITHKCSNSGGSQCKKHRELCTIAQQCCSGRCSNNRCAFIG